jgi:hypothetical protein
VLLAGGWTPVLARQSGDAVQAKVDTFRADLRQRVAREGALDPRIGGLIAASKNQVGIEIGKDGTAVGRARFVFAPKGSDSSFDVVLKGPISSAGEGTPLSETGLANGASVRFGYNLNLFSTTVSSAARAAGIDSIQELARYAIDPSAAPPAARAMVGRLNRNEAAERQPEVENALRVSHSVFLALSMELGRQSYAFLNQDLTPGTTESHTDHVINAGVGYSRIDESSGNPLLFASFGYSDGERHTAQRSRQLCSPIAGGPSLECRAAIIGAPTPGKLHIVDVDVRSWAYAQRIGFNPRYVYERQRNPLTGQVMVTRTGEVALSYLLFKKDDQGHETSALNVGAFTGGVRVGYQKAETSGAFVAIFFGTVLGVN